MSAADAPQTDSGDASEDRVFSLLERRLQALEEDYRRTIEASIPSTQSAEQDLSASNGHAVASNDDSEEDEEDTAVPAGYAPLGAEDDDGDDNEEDIAEDEAHVGSISDAKEDTTSLSTEQVDQIRMAMSSLDLPAPDWAKNLDNETLMKQVKAITDKHLSS